MPHQFSVAQLIGAGRVRRGRRARSWLSERQRSGSGGVPSLALEYLIESTGSVEVFDDEIDST